MPIDPIPGRNAFDRIGSFHETDHHLHGDDVFPPEAALPNDPIFPASKGHKKITAEEKTEQFVTAAALLKAIRGHRS